MNGERGAVARANTAGWAGTAGGRIRGDMGGRVQGKLDGRAAHDRAGSGSRSVQIR